MADSAAKSSDKPIVLLGIGRGGIRIVDLARRSYAFPGLVAVAADTDLATLEGAQVDRTLQLGEAWTRGEGCGGDLDLAERAANASADALRALLQDARMVFAVAGLGGGIGSTAPRLLARLARECSVPTVFLVTEPFSFEGATRARVAEQAGQRLRLEAQTVMVVPNSLLFSRLPPDTTMPRAFEISGELLAKALAGLARICCAKGLLTAELAGVKRIVRHPGCTCSLALGQGQGPEAAETAVREFLASPFLGDARLLETVHAALLTLLGGEDLTIGAVQDCLGQVQAHFPRNAQILVGAYTDTRLQGQLQLTGLLVRAPRDAAGHQPELFPGTPHPDLEPRRTRRPAAGGGEPRQAALPFPEQQLGIFAGSPHPTFHNGENLDVPTFQRRNVPVDPGESL
jgi:cell division protein FtsZ